MPNAPDQILSLSHLVEAGYVPHFRPSAQKSCLTTPCKKRITVVLVDVVWRMPLWQDSAHPRVLRSGTTIAGALRTQRTISAADKRVPWHTDCLPLSEASNSEEPLPALEASSWPGIFSSTLHFYHVDSFPGFFGFWFLVCNATTQLVLQLQQKRIQVGHSNKVVRRIPTDLNGTPAMDSWFEDKRIRRYTKKRWIQKNTHVLLFVYLFLKLIFVLYYIDFYEFYIWSYAFLGSSYIACFILCSGIIIILCIYLCYLHCLDLIYLCLTIIISVLFVFVVLFYLRVYTHIYTYIAILVFQYCSVLGLDSLQAGAISFIELVLYIFHVFESSLFDLFNCVYSVFFPLIWVYVYINRRFSWIIFTTNEMVDRIKNFKSQNN